MPLPRLGACNLRKGKVKARILITGSATQLKWRMKGCKYSCKWHVYIWAIYNDISRGHPKWWFTKGNSLISGKSRLVKYYNLARWDTRTGEIVSIHSTCLGKRFWFPIEIQELMRWSPSQFIVCLLYIYIYNIYIYMLFDSFDTVLPVTCIDWLVLGEHFWRDSLAHLNVSQNCGRTSISWEIVCFRIAISCLFPWNTVKKNMILEFTLPKQAGLVHRVRRLALS